MALPQQHRLRGRRVFDRLYRQGRRFQGPALLLRVLPADPSLLPPARTPGPAPSPWRCGLVISSKVSKLAVHRNRLRRLVHDHLLRHPPAPVSPQWLLISLKPGSLAFGDQHLLEECTQLLGQAGLLDDSGGPGGQQTRDQ